MAETAGEKTELPSQKRLKDAVDKGDILKSREFATALVMLAGVGWILLSGPALIAACSLARTSRRALAPARSPRLDVLPQKKRPRNWPAISKACT